MSAKFQKKVEDFTCEHCGKEVNGNGFTNHCPSCLWSKHVDNNPGDRGAECQGMMQPIYCVQEKDLFILTSKCVVCGLEKRNRLTSQDNVDVAFEIVEKANRKLLGLDK
ncbi:MAG: RNHCP domain-containing protein [Patescibacteria group bacterium]